jgi:hypothetical protein
MYMESAQMTQVNISFKINGKIVATFKSLLYLLNTPMLDPGNTVKMCISSFRQTLKQDLKAHS